MRLRKISIMLKDINSYIVYQNWYFELFYLDLIIKVLFTTFSEYNYLTKPVWNRSVKFIPWQLDISGGFIFLLAPALIKFEQIELYWILISLTRKQMPFRFLYSPIISTFWGSCDEGPRVLTISFFEIDSFSEQNFV